MILVFLVAAAVPGMVFAGMVPPHAAADGDRYQVFVEGSVDPVAAMKACQIDDFVKIDAAGRAYEFAITRSTETEADCLRKSLPPTARIAPRDIWTVDPDVEVGAP